LGIEGMKKIAEHKWDNLKDVNFTDNCIDKEAMGVLGKLDWKNV